MKPKCQGTKGNGEPCTRNATQGEGFCKTHMGQAVEDVAPPEEVIKEVAETPQVVNPVPTSTCSDKMNELEGRGCSINVDIKEDGFQVGINWKWRGENHYLEVADFIEKAPSKQPEEILAYAIDELYPKITKELDTQDEEDKKAADQSIVNQSEEDAAGEIESITPETISEGAISVSDIGEGAVSVEDVQTDYDEDMAKTEGAATDEIVTKMEAVQDEILENTEDREPTDEEMASIEKATKANEEKKRKPRPKINEEFSPNQVVKLIFKGKDMHVPYMKFSQIGNSRHKKCSCRALTREECGR